MTPALTHPWKTYSQGKLKQEPLRSRTSEPMFPVAAHFQLRAKRDILGLAPRLEVPRCLSLRQFLDMEAAMPD